VTNTSFGLFVGNNSLAYCVLWLFHDPEISR